MSILFKALNALWRLWRGCPPLPIPNREVKPRSADGIPTKGGESRSPPIFKHTGSSQKDGPVLFLWLSQQPYYQLQTKLSDSGSCLFLKPAQYCRFFLLPNVNFYFPPKYFSRPLLPCRCTFPAFLYPLPVFYML